MALTKTPIELSSTPSIVDGGNATAITIDSSENVLISGTSSSIDAGSISLEAQGRIRAGRSGGTVLQLNRTTSDGDVAIFYKDGSVVGSIGSAGSGTELYIAGAGTNATGIYLANSGKIVPMKASAISDATQDIGMSSYRWKDLYLSGGAYLGGTGSANKLEDYETGTWTPTVTSSAGTITTVNSQVGTYTKIGRIVMLQFQFNIATLGTASGNIIISGGIPFTEDNSVISYYAGVHRARGGTAKITEFDVSGTLQLYGTTPVAGVYHGSIVYNTAA